MKLVKHNLTNKKKNINNSNFPLNKSCVNDVNNSLKEYNIDNWKNKKINLNFFENKNLIKELRAKYLPESGIQNKNNNEDELNKINNYYKKDYTYANLENKPQISFSIDNFTKSNQTSISNKYKEIRNIKNNYNEENNEIVNKRKSKINANKSNQNNIIIENRFYTEIINSNILLDRNLKLTSFDDEIISTNNLNKKENNHCSYHNLKSNNLVSNKDNNIESSNNKELFNLNNDSKIENESNNYYNIKEAKITNLKCINKGMIEEKNIILENIKMKKEIKNYEKLITPLINYINDINRLLNQKEINLNDIEKIVKHENATKSSFYINNLESKLNGSKNDIIFQLFDFYKNNSRSRKKHYNKLSNIKIKRICRSSEDINKQKNYFYDDTTDKYIFDYYKGRNLECSACQIGNYNSQRGYSPGICFHIDKENKQD